MSYVYSDKAAEYVAQHVRDYLTDVDENVYAQVVGIVADAISDDSGYSEVDYLVGTVYPMAHRDRSDDWHTFTAVAGLAVREYVWDVMIGDELAETWAGKLLTDMLDYGNQALWAEVASSFMPDPEELAERAGVEL